MTEAIVAQKRESIQSRVKSDADVGIGLVLWLASATDLIPPWWSARRDDELRRFWKKVDYLSGAVFTLTSRLSTIPFKVIPKDMSVKAHQKQAEAFQDLLENASEFGAGWPSFFSKWNEDLTTQDNGAFAEIVGPGDVTGPLTGAPLTIASLDSRRCVRTSDPEFPVVYKDVGGGRFKLHHTRVAFSSLMPSPIAEMNNVGFCAISRCINFAQHLLDILIYNQEKLGSRPHRSILIAKGGLDPESVKSAFALAEEDMDNRSLSRYSKNVLVGSSDSPDAGIDIVDLSSPPDGFNLRDSITLGVATIALAFGVDARELFPMIGSGATKADALIQHLKSRGKGIGQLLQIGETELGSKFLPPQLDLVFDYQDDAQDKQVAEIKKVRSERHDIDLKAETLDIRTVREQMLGVGDITQAQFDRLELEEGRMPDGTPVMTLFFSKDHKALLELGVPDPLDVENNDIETMRSIIEDKKNEHLQALGVLTNHRQRQLIIEATAALDALLREYEEKEGQEAIDAMRDAVGESSEEEGDEETPNEDEAEVDEEDMEDGESEGPFDVKDATSFGANIRAAVRGLWTGAFDFFSFVNNMTSAIFKGYEQAWQEGAAQCGFGPADRSMAEQSRLDQEIMSDQGHISSFADFISQNSKANGGKLGKSLARASVWTNRYNYIVGVAQQMSCADMKYQWRRGGTKDPCNDCLTYDGRIHRGSVWAVVGAAPQSQALACHGYNCLCSLIPVTTTAIRANPGRPPRPTG